MSDGGRLIGEPPLSDGGDPDEDREAEIRELAGEIDTDLDVDLQPEEEEEAWTLDEVEVHGGTGPRRIVSERGIDEVFESFEEDTPEEVIDADDDPAPEQSATVEAAEEDLERLLGDLSDVEPDREAPGLDAEEIAKQNREGDGLFVEHGDGGPKQVVGKAKIDELFETFEEDTPGEILATAEAEQSASATTEKHMEFSESDVTMDVGRDRAGGGRPESDEESANAGKTGDEEDDAGDVDLHAALSEVTFDDDDEEGGMGAFVAEDDEELLEQTDDDRHRVVGDSEVEAVFGQFEESSPEEVIDSTDGESEAASDAATTNGEATGDVEGLFADLSAVELDAEAEPATVTAETDPEPVDPEETADEVEGLLDDLAAVDVEKEASGEVEGLFEDIGDVDVEPSEAAESPAPEPTAQTEPTILEPEEEDFGAFQWLGEDIHIFSGDDEDVDEMFESFEESSPEEVMAAAQPPEFDGVSARKLFRAVAEGRTPDADDRPAAADGWGPRAADANGVNASDLFDAVAADAPTVVESDADPSPEADPGEIDLEFDADAETADPIAEGDAESADPLAEGDDVGELDLEFDDEQDQEASSDSGTDIQDIAEAAEAAEAEAADEAETADEADGVATESDVDAVFERFEEDSPEEIIESADDPAAQQSEVVIEDEAVEQLFGDLSGIDLEAESAAEPTAPSAEPGPAPEPGSQEAEDEVEQLFGDLSELDFEDAESESEPEPVSEPEPAQTESEKRKAEASDDEMLEQTSEDTHVATGDSDVDAVFERFEEASPEEIVDAFDLGEEAEEELRDNETSVGEHALDDGIDAGDDIVADSERASDADTADQQVSDVTLSNEEPDGQLFTASEEGTGSETLFPEAAQEDQQPDSQPQQQDTPSKDDDEESSGGIVSKITGVLDRLLGVI